MVQQLAGQQATLARGRGRRAHRGPRPSCETRPRPKPRRAPQGSARGSRQRRGGPDLRPSQPLPVRDEGRSPPAHGLPAERAGRDRQGLSRRLAVAEIACRRCRGSRLRPRSGWPAPCPSRARSTGSRASATTCNTGSSSWSRASTARPSCPSSARPRESRAPSPSTAWARSTRGEASPRRRKPRSTRALEVKPDFSEASNGLGRPPGPGRQPARGGGALQDRPRDHSGLPGRPQQPRVRSPPDGSEPRGVRSLPEGPRPPARLPRGVQQPRHLLRARGDPPRAEASFKQAVREASRLRRGGQQPGPRAHGPGGRGGRHRGAPATARGERPSSR